MRMKKRMLHLILLAMLLLAGCKKSVEEKESGNYQHRGDTVIVANPILNEKLKVTEVQLLPYSKDFFIYFNQSRESLSSFVQNLERNILFK